MLDWVNVFDSVAYMPFISYSESIIQTSGGDLIQATKVGVESALLKMDGEGSILDTAISNAWYYYHTVIELANGNFLAAGVPYDHESMCLHWYSPDFELLNEVIIDPFDWCVFYRQSRLIELQNGDILLSGYGIYETPEFYVDANQYVCRMSNSGEILWVSTFDFDYMDWTIYPVEDNDGGLTAFFGHVNWVEDPDGYREFHHGQIGTMEIDPASGDSSNVILYNQELNHYLISDFQHMPDGGYIGSGQYVDSEATFPNVSFLIKFDENREVEWFKKIEYNSDLGWEGQISFLWDIEVLPDSSIVGGGYWFSGTDAGVRSWVFRTDACGDLMWNNCGVTSYTEIDKQDFTVYPNPFTDYLAIEIPIQSDELEVRDLSGKLVLQQKTFSAQQLKLNLSSLPEGAYILTINTSEGKMSKAILK